MKYFSEIRDYKDVLLEAKIDGWSEMTPLQKLVAYRNFGKDIPDCDACEDVMLQYENYYFSRRKNLKVVSKITKYGICNELRNELGLVMKGDTMTSPWRIVKDFARYECNIKDSTSFEEEFYEWCSKIDKAYRENTLNELEEKLLKFISIAHTPGNFCIVPQMFNVGRSGLFAENDKWELTLKVIEKWYETRDDECLREMMGYKYLDKELDKAVNYAIEWLDEFDDFAEFCILNFFNMYIGDEEPDEKDKNDESKTWNIMLDKLIKRIEERSSELLLHGIIGANRSYHRGYRIYEKIYDRIKPFKGKLNLVSMEKKDKEKFNKTMRFIKLRPLWYDEKMQLLELGWEGEDRELINIIKEYKSKIEKAVVKETGMHIRVLIHNIEPWSIEKETRAYALSTLMYEMDLKERDIAYFEGTDMLATYLAEEDDIVQTSKTKEIEKFEKENDAIVYYRIETKFRGEDPVFEDGQPIVIFLYYVCDDISCLPMQTPDLIGNETTNVLVYARDGFGRGYNKPEFRKATFEKVGRGKLLPKDGKLGIINS